MKKLLLTLLLGAAMTHAQIPAPLITLGTNIGPGGVFPFRNAGTLIFASDADRPMVYPEMSASFLKVTSSVSLTATRNLIAPLTIGFTFTIENATTGGQSIQVIGSTGTGVTIANGATQVVVSDGTNYVSAGGGSGGAVSSVFTRTGNVVAQSGDYNVGQVTGAAPLASPTLTGTPAAPTPATTDNSTTIPTTAYVRAYIASLSYVTGSGTSGHCVQWGASNTLGDAGSACGSGGGGPTIQTNGTNNITQSTLNFVTSLTNVTGLTVTPANPAGGQELEEVSGTVNPTHGGTGSTTAPSANMVYIAQTGTDVEPKAISQDASVAATGAWTNTGINGTPVPHSQALVGTDSSGVIVPGTISQASITSALGYTPAPIASLPDTANLTFDYRFSDTTGATLTDYSGFNRNAAITNGSGLTRSGISYLMTSPAQVDLPTTVNGTNSYYFLSNLPVAQTGVSWGFNSNDGFLVNPSGGWGTQGVTIYTGGNIGTITISASPGVYGLEALGASAIVNSQVSDIIGAVHVIGLVCGTSSTTFYLDGYPLTNFRSTGNCNGANTVGNLRFQPQTTGVGYYYYRALGFSDVHSAATVLQVSTAIRAQGLAVGVPFTPVPYQSPKTFYFAAGDSITCGFGLSGCTGGGTSTLSYPALVPALLTNTYTSQNYGIPAALVQQQIITAPATYQPLCNTASGQTIASLMEGTNNFQGTSVATAASVFQLNVAWGRLMKTAGCRYTFIAMISRTGNANNGAITYDAAKNNLNAVFRSGWAQSGANGFVDVGADPHLGCDGCYSNSTYFQGDGIHPTAAGQTILANADACIINGMDGSSPQLPNPTPITASTYTATCSDGGLIADTSSNNITITLNSALWQTGRVVQVCNNSASGSNALTVAAPSDFPFDNILGRTTATIANHSCQQWQAMFNGNTTTPGDFWQTGVQ